MGAGVEEGPTILTTFKFSTREKTHPSGTPHLQGDGRPVRQRHVAANYTKVSKRVDALAFLVTNSSVQEEMEQPGGLLVHACEL